MTESQNGNIPSLSASLLERAKAEAFLLGITLKELVLWKSKRVENYLKWFVIFMIWPVISLFNSVTFYIFIAFYAFLSSNLSRVIRFNRFASVLFALFGASVFLSMLLGPEITRKAFSQFDELKYTFQYIYWMILATFFLNHTYKFDIYKLSRFAFYGVILLIINFYVFNGLINILFIRTNIARNSFVYTLLAAFPISTFFIYKAYKNKGLNLYCIVMLVVMLFTNGRAGAILILLEVLLVQVLYQRKFYKALRVTLIFLLPVFVLNENTGMLSYFQMGLARQVEIISPRFAELLRGEGSGNLKMDKSWLIRELMIEKAKEINQKHPIFGVGPYNFELYDAVLDASKEERYRFLYISYYGIDYYNKKSSHNSYILVLAEQGLIGAGIYLLIMIPLVFSFVKKLLFEEFTTNDLFLISFIVVSFHFYGISALPNTLTWFLIGGCYSFHYYGYRLEKANKALIPLQNSSFNLKGQAQAVLR